MFVKRTGIAVALAVVACSFAGTAAVAAKPVSTTFTESFSDEVFAECDGFDVLESAVVHGRDTVYFDREGTHAIRHVLQLRVSGTFTNSVTGDTMSNHSSFMIDEGLNNPDAIKEGPRPGTFRVIGLEFQIKENGRVVALQGGQLFVDIHDHDNPFDDEVVLHAGRHDLDDGFDICEALSS